MALVQARLAAVRRATRARVATRAIGWLLSIPTLTFLVAVALDWRLHLPGIIRAAILGIALAAFGCTVAWFVVHFIRARTDDLSLALQIEQRFPELNDALASAVEFAAAGSAPSAMHREIVRRASQQIRESRSQARVASLETASPVSGDLRGLSGWYRSRARSPRQRFDRLTAICRSLRLR